MYTAKLSKYEWTLCESIEDFASLYTCLPGEPQPWTSPHQYPCLIKEICIMHNSNGADQQILDFLYNFEIHYFEE